MGKELIPSQKIRPWSMATEKERLFVDHYMTNGYNVADAFDQAGYSQKSRRTARRANAHQVFRRPHVRAEIDRRMRQVVMSEDEALARHSEVGRGDIGDCLVDHEVACPTCGHIIEEAGTLRLDLKLLKQHGLTYLIKKLTPFKDGRVGIELYEADKARQDIMRAHGTFKGAEADAGNTLVGLMAAAARAAAERNGNGTAVEAEYTIEDGETPEAE